MTKPKSPKTQKAEQTRARIVEASLELFRTKGYDATTMRAIAEHAGVSTGNAYYYFKSKELLLEAFYRQIHVDHAAASKAVLDKERDLRKRLLGVMQAKLEVIEPNHDFASRIFATASNPKSPLNPFHEAGMKTRLDGEAIFAQVLEGSKLKIPKDLALELPHLLWTYSMGIVLYWIHDDSPERRRTHRLVESSTDLVVRLVGLASNPLMRPLRKRVLKMLSDLRLDD